MGATRETSKETSEAMQGHRVVARMEQPYSGNFKLLKQEGGPKEMTIEDIDTAMAELTVTKMKKVGKYSGRLPRELKQGEDLDKETQEDCQNCTSKHSKDRCPARDKTCYACDRPGHFARSKACKGKKVRTRTMRVDDEEYLEESNE